MAEVKDDHALDQELEELDELEEVEELELDWEEDPLFPELEFDDELEEEEELDELEELEPEAEPDAMSVSPESGSPTSPGISQTC